MTPQGASTAVAGRYAIGELLGRGGMGEVFDAVDLRLDRAVALKRLRADLAHDPTMRRRVEVEARLAARLVHPNVVTVFDSGVEDGHPFIVMERLDSRTLGDALADGPLAAADVRAVGLQILEALAAAHDIGLIHRDVKPGNVLAAGGGGWKVADFGIATSTDADHTITRTGELLGSPSYLAPERIEGRPATPVSDLYALGVLLYEAATGVRPFGDDAPLALAMRIREGIHVPLREAARGIDAELASAIERAMSVDPTARFGSAREMASALRSLPEIAFPSDPADPVATAPIRRSADPTDVLDPVGSHAGTTARLEPSAPRDEQAPEAAPDDARARPHGSRLLLASLIVGVLVVTLVVAAVLLRSGGEGSVADRPGAPSQRAGDVPAPLQDALDRLQETITP